MSAVAFEYSPLPSSASVNGLIILLTVVLKNGD